MGIEMQSRIFDQKRVAREKTEEKKTFLGALDWYHIYKNEEL